MQCSGIGASERPPPRKAHYKLASGLRRKNLALGVPVVIFSTIVGTSLFTTLADPEAVIPAMFKIATGSISVAAAILAALQNFLRFGERAEKHVVAAGWYAAARRDIEQVLALSAEERGKKDCFNPIRKEMSKIGQQTPEIGDRMWKVMAKNTVWTPFCRVAVPPRAGSSFTNGKAKIRR